MVFKKRYITVNLYCEKGCKTWYVASPDASYHINKSFKGGRLHTSKFRPWEYKYHEDGSPVLPAESSSTSSSSSSSQNVDNVLRWFRKLTCYPGDILINPARYWHGVETKGSCIAVNWWWVHNKQNNDELIAKEKEILPKNDESWICSGCSTENEANPDHNEAFPPSCKVCCHIKGGSLLDWRCKVCTNNNKTKLKNGLVPTTVSCICSTERGSTELPTYIDESGQTETSVHVKTNVVSSNNATTCDVPILEQTEQEGVGASVGTNVDDCGMFDEIPDCISKQETNEENIGPEDSRNTLVHIKKQRHHDVDIETQRSFDVDRKPKKLKSSSCHIEEEVTWIDQSVHSSNLMDDNLLNEERKMVIIDEDATYEAKISSSSSSSQSHAAELSSGGTRKSSCSSGSASDDITIQVDNDMKNSLHDVVEVIDISDDDSNIDNEQQAEEEEEETQPIYEHRPLATTATSTAPPTPPIAPPNLTNQEATGEVSITWTCVRCTFINQVNVDDCEMCSGDWE